MGWDLIVRTLIFFGAADTVHGGLPRPRPKHGITTRTNNIPIANLLDSTVR